MICVSLGTVTERSPEILQPDKMSVQASPADLVTSGTRHYRRTESCHQRSHHHYGSSQRFSLFTELVPLNIRKIHLIGLKLHLRWSNIIHFYTHLGQQGYKVAHVRDLRQI